MTDNIEPEVIYIGNLKWLNGVGDMVFQTRICESQAGRLWLWALHHIREVDGIVQERRKSSALAMELRLSWTYTSK